jgi:hypothetical protein
VKYRSFRDQPANIAASEAGLAMMPTGGCSMEAGDIIQQPYTCFRAPRSLAVAQTTGSGVRPE